MVYLFQRPRLLQFLLAAAFFSSAAGSPSHAFDVLNWRWANPAPHGNNIKAMIAINGTFLQVCELGQVYSSDDLSLWIPQPSHTTNALRAVTFFQGKFVISGEAGTIVAGSSPSTLQSTFLGTTDWLEGIAASPATVVAVGDNGAIYTSSDAQSWSRVAAPFQDWMLSVAYGTPTGIGKFVAVGESGFLAVSSNGKQWQTLPTFTTENLNSVTWLNNQFCVIGDAGQTFFSSTGLSWTPTTTGATNSLYASAVAPQTGTLLVAGESELRLAEGRGLWADQLSPQQASPAPAWPYYSTAWSGSEFLLGGRTGMFVEGFKTNSTASPTLWLPSNDSLRNWVWDSKRWPGLYITAGDRATILTSPDGIDWTFELVPDSATNSILLGIGGRTNLAVAVGNAGTILTSSSQFRSITTTNSSGATATNQVDAIGVIWSAVDPRPTTVDLQGITASQNLLVASGGNGTILTSTDGSHWTPRSTPTTRFLTSVESFPAGFVASGDQGTLLFSSDGVSWNQIVTRSTNWLFRTRYRGGKLIVLGQNGALLTSTNGTSWTGQNSGTTEWLTDVDWLENTYVAVGTHGTVLLSTNAVDWFPTPIITEKSLYTATHAGGQLLVGGVEGILLRSDIAPPTTPILIQYTPSRSSSNIVDQQFVFSGDPAQSFTLDHTTDLINWITGPRFQFLDSSGYLIYSEQSTNPPPHLFFRAKLATP